MPGVGPHYLELISSLMVLPLISIKAKKRKKDPVVKLHRFLIVLHKKMERSNSEYFQLHKNKPLAEIRPYASRSFF